MKGSAAPERPIERGGRGEARRDATWPTVRLDDVAVTSSGGTPPRSRPDYYGGTIPWAKIEDLTRNGMWLRETEEHVTETATHETNAKVFPARTVLVAMYGSIGTTSIAEIPVSCNQAILGCECGPDLHPEYLYYWFTLVRRQLLARGRGGTQANLNAGIFNALEIPLPPLAEQERIAGRLTEQLGAVERARAAAAQRLAAAEALPAALLREVFGDPPPFDASPLAPSTPTKPGWKWHRLTSLARLATGHTPSRRCPEYWNGDIPWIQLPDIRALDGRVAMDTSEHTNALGIENSAAVRLPAGTVCLSRTASVGFVTIMGREMATSQDFVNWVCGPDLDPSFLMHLFIACRKPIRDLGSGAVHHTIYFPTVEQFSVCVPDLPTQRRLAAEITQRLAAAEGVIARCREELAAIEALPASLLRDAFGGAEARE